MKKSNKILAGIFLAALLIFSAVHVALYANLKAGKYTLYKDGRLNTQLGQPLPAVKQVAIRNAKDVFIYAAATARIQFDSKEDSAAYTYTVQGDTLVIAGKDTSKNADWRGNVTLYLPDSATVIAYNASLFFRGGAGGLQTPSFAIQLNASQLHLSGENEEAVAFTNLTVSAQNTSEIHLAKARIGTLTATLQDSFLEDEAAQLDTFLLQADALSKMTLTSPNFSKAKTKPAHE